jgi:hypothetical protein
MNVTDLYYEGQAEIGIGAQLKIRVGDESPANYVAVAEMKSAKPGRMEAAIHDKSHTRSPKRTREKKVGMIDQQPWSFVLNWSPEHGSQNNAGGDGFDEFEEGTEEDPSEGGGLLAMFLRGDELEMQITRVGKDPIPFRGSVSAYEIGEISIENLTTLTVEITPLSAFAHLIG